MAKMRMQLRGATTMAVAMLAMVSCKEKSAPGSGVPDASVPAAESGVQEPGFTRAEIRRETPLEIDTAGLAKSAAKDAGPATKGKDTVAAPPKPLPVQAQPPKKEPVAVATPAAPVGKAEAVPVSGSVVPNETGEWVLQVNVHKSEADAKAQISKLGQAGIPAYAVPVPTGDANLSGNYWRVRVGRFTTRADAQTYGKSVLEPKGLKFWIDRKSNESRQGA